MSISGIKVVIYKFIILKIYLFILAFKKIILSVVIIIILGEVGRPLLNKSIALTRDLYIFVKSVILDTFKFKDLYLYPSISIALLLIILNFIVCSMELVKGITHVFVNYKEKDYKQASFFGNFNWGNDLYPPTTASDSGSDKDRMEYIRATSPISNTNLEGQVDGGSTNGSIINDPVRLAVDGESEARLTIFEKLFVHWHLFPGRENFRPLDLPFPSVSVQDQLNGIAIPAHEDFSLHGISRADHDRYEPDPYGFTSRVRTVPAWDPASEIDKRPASEYDFNHREERKKFFSFQAKYSRGLDLSIASEVTHSYYNSGNDSRLNEPGIEGSLETYVSKEKQEFEIFKKFFYKEEKRIREEYLLSAIGSQAKESMLANNLREAEIISQYRAEQAQLRLERRAAEAAAERLEAEQRNTKIREWMRIQEVESKIMEDKFKIVMESLKRKREDSES